MKQSEFLQYLKGSKFRKNQLKRAVINGGDGGFYFTLGTIFGDLNINGWESETFINKVCAICNIEF
jgi:hypothetical protein